MKLRIRGSSVRLRLEPSEVETFARDGRVTERAALGETMTLEYGLLAADIDTVELAYDGHGLTVRVPRALARHWAEGDEIGFEAQVRVGKERVGKERVGGERVRILVEKDLPCRHPSGED